MKKISFINYLLIAMVVTVIFGVQYVAIQQNYRSNANDPQIQTAREINLKLHERKSIDQYFNDTIDIAQSLFPFIVLYDKNEKPLRSSGYLNGEMPELPKGVFDFAKKNGEHDVTWQPQNGVRMAMAIVYSNSFPVSFIGVGRSLHEVEIRESNLITIVFIGLIICIGLILTYAVIQFYDNAKRPYTK